MTKLDEKSTSKNVTISNGPLNDFNLHYHDTGVGTPVLYLHGSGPGASAWSNFYRNVVPIANEGYRLIMLDLPGWNKSDPIYLEHGTRAEANVAAIVGLLDHMALERVHVVGNSMGGAAALSLAMDYPERVGKLVIMGAGGGVGSTFAPMPTEGIKLMLSLYREPSLGNLERLMQNFVYDASALTPALLQGRFENIERSNIHIQNFLASMKVNPHSLLVDLSSRLSEVTAPVLITWGRDDRFVPLDAGLKLLAGLADSRMYIFNKCGHWAQWEKAEEFNTLLLAYLGD